MHQIGYLCLLRSKNFCSSSFTAVYEYAAVCIPDYHTRTDIYTYCDINIISQTETNIQITTAYDSSSFSLKQGELFQRSFSDDFIPTQGIETKAIRIVSDDEVQVLLYVHRNTGWTNYDEVYMVPNHLRAQNTYFITAYNYGGGACDDTDRYNQFYLVTSFYNETSLYVVQRDGTVYDLELPEFGTFLQTTTDPYLYLASGTDITSNKPINVVSGNLCLSKDDALGTCVSSIPSVGYLGREYIAPKIINDVSPPGFSLTVVATADDTLVVSDGIAETLGKGEMTTFDYPDIFQKCFC